MSMVEDVEKLIWEVERRPPLYKIMQEYIDINLKEKLWYEVLRVDHHELERTCSWTEIRKRYVNLLINVIGDHADGVNILGLSVHTTKKNTLVFASKETGVEVNTDKTKYMAMFQDQNAGRSHTIKTDNRSFERLEQFRYLGTNLTNQNSIQEEIKCWLKSQNACYHSVLNLLSSSLLSKNINIQVYRTTVFLLFCKGVKLGQNK